MKHEHEDELKHAGAQSRAFGADSTDKLAARQLPDVDCLLHRRVEHNFGEKMMSETIKCCPFCGGHKVQVCRTNPNACWIRCDACGADADSHPTRKGAIANWNRRHYDETPAVIVDDDETPRRVMRSNT